MRNSGRFEVNQFFTLPHDRLNSRRPAQISAQFALRCAFWMSREDGLGNRTSYLKSLVKAPARSLKAQLPLVKEPLLLIIPFSGESGSSLRVERLLEDLLWGANEAFGSIVAMGVASPSVVAARFARSF